MLCGTTLQFCLQSKNIWVTSTLFWTSQLHTCCVRDTLHNFKRDASYLNQSLSVLEKLLSQLGSSYKNLYSYLVTLLAFVLVPQKCNQGTLPGADL